jgi:glucan phosphorylase
MDELLIPRQLEIIFEINRRLMDDIRAQFPGDLGRAARASLIEEGQTKHVPMANLAIVGSHSTNGVAAIHSRLVRETTVRDLAPHDSTTKQTASRRGAVCASPIRLWELPFRLRLARRGSLTLHS